MASLSVTDCVRFGWDTFKKRPWFFVGATFVIFVVNLMVQIATNDPGVSAGGFTPADIAYLVVTGVVGFVLSTLLNMGIVWFSLKAHDDAAAVKLEDLWRPTPFLKFLLMSILVSVLVIVGLIFLIIPGVVLALLFTFCSYLVMERQLGPIAAIKESARIAKKHLWKIFLLFLAVGALNILGFIALLVGLFVSVPVSLLATAHAYRVLTSEASPEAPAVVS